MAGDLNALLGQASASLAVHRANTATISHNIANANTPGYARQRAVLAAALPAEDTGKGNIGRGVSLMGITQARDKFLETQMPNAMGNQARSSAEADTLESISALDPDAQSGLTDTLSKFYTSLRTLSQNPGDRGSRQAVVAAGQALALSFNRADAALETARTAADAKLAATVTDINRAAASVAALNKSVREGLATDSAPNDLMDARQKSLDTLAQLTGAHAIETGNGTVNVVLPNGMPLVVGFVSSTMGTISNNANGSHLDMTITPPGGGAGSGQVLPGSGIGGTIGGLIDARDTGMANARVGLDQAAYDFSNAFNTIHRAGFGLDGTAGRDFFEPLASATNASRTISVSSTMISNPSLLGVSATSTGLPGDADNLFNLVASEDGTLAGGANIGQTLGQIIADYGSRAGEARARFQQDDHALSHLEDLRESTSGVSIDEELVSLTQSQHAFEAVMKVITTADKMLETLMSIR